MVLMSKDIEDQLRVFANVMVLMSKDIEDQHRAACRSLLKMDICSF